jgi:hypothetical protein
MESDQELIKVTTVAEYASMETFLILSALIENRRVIRLRQASNWITKLY